MREFWIGFVKGVRDTLSLFGAAVLLVLAFCIVVTLLDLAC